METSNTAESQPYKNGGLFEPSTELLLKREFENLPDNDAFKQAFDIADTLRLIDDRFFSDAQRTAVITALEDEHWLRNNAVIDGMVGAIQTTGYENLDSECLRDEVKARVLQRAESTHKERAESSIFLRESLADAAADFQQLKDKSNTNPTRLKNAEQYRDNLRSALGANEISQLTIKKFLSLQHEEPDEFNQSIDRAMIEVTERVEHIVDELNRNKFDTGEIQILINTEKQKSPLN